MDAGYFSASAWRTCFSRIGVDGADEGRARALTKSAREPAGAGVGRDGRAAASGDGMARRTTADQCGIPGRKPLAASIGPLRISGFRRAHDAVEWVRG